MRRSAGARGAVAAHKVAAPSPSGLGVASNGSMNPESATARAKRISGPHARSSELRDGEIKSPDQCGDARARCLERHPAQLRRHGRSRWISQCVQHQTLSVEDGAKTEIRVGPGALTADLERAGCAVILRYRSAELLSGFTRYITFNSAADLSLSWCLYRSSHPPGHSRRCFKRPSSCPASLAPAPHAPRAPPAPPPPPAPSALPAPPPRSCAPPHPRAWEAAQTTNETDWPS